MKIHQILCYATCLFFLTVGFVHAAVLVSTDDNYGIPSDRFLQVEFPGVLDNDTLDGLNAGEGGATVELLSTVVGGTLSCPTDLTRQLCVDGSFDYTPDPDFNGTDSFTYRAVSGVDVSAPATVSLSACSGGPTIFTCWHEAPYLAKLSELSYNNVFLEGFEGPVWDVARSPAAVQSVVSKGITWTTNHPLTNNITTGHGPARTGFWGGFDPDHGLATETNPTICDVDVVPIECRPHDGLSGETQTGGDKLHGVGGYISGFTNASITIILDGTFYNIGKLPGAGHHFFGVIDASTAGFSAFEFQEQDGKSGQELIIFGDDFIIAASGAAPVNNPPVLSLLDDLVVPPEPVVSPSTVNENELLSILLTATDPDDGDSWSFLVSGAPAGSILDDNFDGTATFSWRPTFNQAGSYPLSFTVTDNGIPVESASESITINVNDVVPPAGDLRFSTSNYSVAENGVSKTITVTRVNGSFGTVGVDFATSDNTAKAGSDYTANSGSLSFADGVLSQTFSVSVTDDFIYEGDESLSLNLSNPTGSASLIFPAIASLTITDDDVTADVTAPVISLLGITPVSVELGSTYTDAGASASDNIDGDISANIVPTSTVNTALVGSYTVTYKVSDAAGNPAAAVVRAVNVTADVTAPVISLLGITPVSVELGSTYTDAGASASDNIDGDISANIVPTSTVNTALVGSYTVTYKVSDAAGNPAAAVVRAVNVTADVTAPVISLLGITPVSVELGSTYTDAGASASDNIDGDISANIVPTSTVNTALVGSYTVTYKVSDAAGNPAAAVVRAVNVTADVTAPVISLLGITPVSVELGSTYTDAGASASDNIDGDISANIVPTSTVNTALVGSYTVTYKVSDAAGNPAAAVVRAVNVTADVTAPVISLLGITPVSVELGSTYTDAGASASDNIDGDISANIVPTSTVNTALVGSYTVTYKVSDAAGNPAAAVVRAVNVTADVTAPVISLLGITPVSVELGSTYTDAGASASDNIDGDISANIVPTSTVNTALVGSYTVTYKVSDAAGNPAAAVVRAVNVTADVTAPVISLLGITPVSVELGSTYTDAGASASDNIDGDISANIVPTSTVNTALVGSYTVTYKVSDAAGNPAAAVVRAVNVTADVTAPVISLLGITPVSVELGSTYTDAGASASDNIDGDISANIVPTSTVNTALVGSYTVTYKVSDAAGNPAASALRTVNVFAPAAGSLQFSGPLYTIAENGISATITVTRSGGSFGKVSVDYSSIAGGSAVAGGDYIALAGTLSFADNEMNQTFSVDIIDDADYEGDETINLLLSNVSGASLGAPSSAVLTITENESVPATGSLQFSAPIYSENENGVTATITVTRVGGSFGTVSVDYASADGSAMAGSDYAAVIGSLSFADGEMSQTFSVDIIDDADYEGDETLSLMLSNPTGGTGLGSPALAILTISEDDPVPPTGSLQFSAPIYSENENGVTATITVTRIGGSFGTVSVDYASADGSAMAGSDYAAVIGSLSFADGEMSQTFSVDIIDDADYEGDETLSLMLSNPTGGTGLGSPALAILTISEDDPVPPTGSLQFSAPIYSENENGVTATITVTRVGGSFGTVSVDYASADGSAMAGSDYTAVIGSLSFADGEMSQTFSVDIIDDADYEGDETLSLMLSNPTGGTGLGSPALAILTISEDDPVPPTGSLQFSAATYSVAENITSATITVTRIGGSFGTVGVDYATSDGPAKAGSDYTATSGTLSFADGILSQTFIVTILDDITYEGDEMLKLTLSKPTGGAGLIKPNIAAVVILENDPFSDTRVEPNDNSNGAGGGGSSSIYLITLLLLFSLYFRNLQFSKYGLYRIPR